MTDVGDEGKELSMYYLYGIFNKTNGKLYVGFTVDMKRRWYEHTKHSKKLTKNSFAIHYAINKYGVQNFIYKKIDEATDLDQANKKEIAWIKELKLSGYQLYNETDGGDGTRGATGHKWPDERKQHMSKLNSGEGNPMYGVQLYGETNGNYGKKMQPHVKEALLKVRAKVTKEQSKEICDLFSTGKYKQVELCKKFNLSAAQISRIISGKRWNKN